MPDLLLELFSEEIPARMQARAAADLKRLVTDHLVEAGLTYASAGAFATPRRLTLTLTDLPDATQAVREERKGPRTDAPEKAIEGFLRATGLSREALEVRNDKKGQVYFAVIEKPGRPADAVVAEAVEAAVRGFPWPKSMRWGSGSLRWVRPLARILCQLSDEAGHRTVPVSVEGIEAGAETEGHRFMNRGPISVAGFEDYETKLRTHNVILDPEERAERIWHDATQRAFAAGLELVEDKGLLAEVAGLVEWPVVLMGEIGQEFLGLPPEVLQTSMREHQKFFSVRAPETGRIERFVTVANIETRDAGATILAGNRKVLAARLSDAKFFWENDLRKVADKGIEGMETMAAPLANVVFHEKLGTQAERVARIAALAREIAPAVGADPDLAEQAARVAKADLASEMVYEFPELQGIMGAHYARAAGLPAPVAAACETHYRPLGRSDAVPEEPVAIAVALADKIDMLTGFWAIGEKPTGSGDPFALRRAALGVIRTILHHDIRRPLFEAAIGALNAHVDAIIRRDRRLLLEETKLAEALGGLDGDVVEAGTKLLSERVAAAEAEIAASTGHTLVALVDLASFIDDRLKVLMRDEGLRHDVIDAVAGRAQRDVVAVRVAKARAMQAFLDTEDGTNLLAAYRRASNIVAAEEKKDGRAYDAAPDPARAAEPAEQALFEALETLAPRVETALKAEDFGEAMAAMAALRAPVDTFFDDVTVNGDDAGLRENRLCLLNALRALMRRVAAWDAIQD
ncbi:MAG: glycine--tRNA ligase subunit beta [Pseudomonadota bacterium]